LKVGHYLYVLHCGQAADGDGIQLIGMIMTTIPLLLLF